jgi:uncharacterized protein HemX
MPRVPVAAPPEKNGGMEGIWKWVAAIVVALMVGLTPYIISSQAQKNYASKDDVAALQAQFVALSERVARNEEQITQATDSIATLLELAQNGETRLSDIEAALARIEAIFTVNQSNPTP